MVRKGKGTGYIEVKESRGKENMDADWKGLHISGNYV